MARFFTEMFRRFFARRKAPLTGAPALRRLKTYSAQSGYVYQYFYEGHRLLSSDHEEGTEFVFSVSGDRKLWHPVEVVVPDASLQNWEHAHDRQLYSTERYAVAKLSLFQAFDERAAPDRMREPVRVREADVEAIIETLDL